MPRKLLDADTVPTLVGERLLVWGRSIHAQRIRQRITAAGLCERAGLSHGTLRRLERGDPGTAASAYLSALMTLGLLEEAAPALPASLWASERGLRVRLRHDERADAHDGADYF